jgi:hypothetical protein
MRATFIQMKCKSYNYSYHYWTTENAYKLENKCTFTASGSNIVKQYVRTNKYGSMWNVSTISYLPIQESVMASMTPQTFWDQIAVCGDM